MRRFAFHLALRVAVEGLLVRLRRRPPSAERPDSVLGLLVLGSFVAVPVYVVVVLLWLLTGRGPGGRWVAVDRGAPRQRP
jgi:hypothetical protein